MGAAEAWAEALNAWAIPVHILSQAPEAPFAYPAALFRASAGHTSAATTAERLARGALGADRTVLDVGCGGGIASIRLATHARRLIGVDLSTAMLANFAEAAEAAGVGHREILGRWPDVAGRTPRCDVVVCRNVVYNVADLVPFLSALSDRAAHRVIVELPARDPRQLLAPLWEQFWGLEFPLLPTAEDFVEVVRETGAEPTARTELRTEALPGVSREEYVTLVRRRLCLTPERDPEIDLALGPELPMAVSVTVSWNPTS